MADLILKRGKQTVLQTDDTDYNRGLLVKLLDDGGYDVAYWYNNPDKPYPIEVKVDGESVKKDAKIVHLRFHPELKSESIMKTFHVDEPREIGKRKDRLSSKEMMMVKKDLSDAATVLYVGSQALIICSMLLHPIMPNRVKKLLDVFNVKSIDKTWGSLPVGSKLALHQPLFPRIKSN
mgnify:CR=1 FL=1